MEPHTQKVPLDEACFEGYSSHAWQALTAFATQSLLHSCSVLSHLPPATPGREVSLEPGAGGTLLFLSL